MKPVVFICDWKPIFHYEFIRPFMDIDTKSRCELPVSLEGLAGVIVHNWHDPEGLAKYAQRCASENVFLIVQYTSDFARETIRELVFPPVLPKRVSFVKGHDEIVDRVKEYTLSLAE